MATPVSLSKLILRTRQRVNIEGHPEAIDDAELTDMLNQSIAGWWDLVRLTTWGGQYARVPWPITMTGALSYPLAPNTASIISVDLLTPGSTQPIPIYAYQEEQRGMFAALPIMVWMPGVSGIYYQQQGSSIAFRPLPSAGYQITVNYEPTAPVLGSGGSSSLDSINGWEEWIVLDSAIKCATKIGLLELIGSLRLDKAEQTQRIERAAAQADKNQSEGVHETEAYRTWNIWSYP